jgi:transposase InsO family protein
VVLQHCGAERSYRSLLLHFYHPQLKPFIANFVRFCDDCQKHKHSGRGYGEMPPREAIFAPFYEVAVDLIGPWKITINGEVHVLSALTMIDTATNLTELVRIDNKTALHVAQKFEIGWLFRYPRPVRCIHDHGNEFIGAAFQHLLALWGIEAHPISIRNPQANSVCERMHQTVGNLLQPYSLAYSSSTTFG